MEITPRPVRSTTFKHDAPIREEQHDAVPSARVLAQIPDLNTEAEAMGPYRPALRKVYINPKYAMAAIAVVLMACALLWLRGGDEAEATADTAPDWQVTSPNTTQLADAQSEMTPVAVTGSLAGTATESPLTNWNAEQVPPSGSAPPLMASHEAVRPEGHQHAAGFADTQTTQYPPQQNAMQQGPSFTWPPIQTPQSDGAQSNTAFPNSNAYPNNTAYPDNAGPQYPEQTGPYGQNGPMTGPTPSAQTNLTSSSPSYPSTAYGESVLPANPHATGNLATSHGVQQFAPSQSPAGQQQFNSWQNQQVTSQPVPPTWANQPAQQQSTFTQPNYRVATRPDVQAPMNQSRMGQPGVAQPTGQITHPTGEPRHEQHGSSLY